MIRKFFKLPRANVALVQYTIEGYEGMATVTTCDSGSDSREALIQVLIIPEFFEELINVVNSLKDRYQIVEILDN